MKGLLAGLVLGFALGVGVMQLFREEGDLPASPPVRPDPSPGASGRLAPPPGSTPEGASAQGESSSRGKTTRGGDMAPARVAPASRPRVVNPHPELSWSDAELVAALRTLAAGGDVGLHMNPLTSANLVSSRIWSRSWPPTNLRIPLSVVEELLASKVKGLRTVGAGLLALAEPLPLDRIARLARSDPAPAVRRAVAGTLSLPTRNHPQLVEVLTRSARDPDPLVRSSALKTLANLVAWRPSLGEWVAAGTRDPDPNVRRYALDLLREAGDAGAARALDMLLADEFDLDDLESLMKSAVAGGRIGEILDRLPRPEVVTALVGALEGREEPALSALVGRFEELLPLYQPESYGEAEGYVDFFRLAVAAGETDFLRKTMASTKRSDAVRLSALAACVSGDRTTELAVDGLRMILGDHDSNARFRERALGMLEWWGESPRKSPGLREIAREAEANDPSIWVRERAEELLREFK